jgi:hypothetical protein
VPLAPFGLLLATAMSVTNVLTGVARKHALEKRDLVPATFRMRVGVTFCFGSALARKVPAGKPVVIRDGGALFGIQRRHLALTKDNSVSGSNSHSPSTVSSAVDQFGFRQ